MKINDFTLGEIANDFRHYFTNILSDCKKRMNLATNNGNTWSDKTVLFGH